jgi:hypothetical protein
LKRKREEEVMSIMTTPSVSSVCTNGTQSTSGMSSLTQESTRYKKHGVTFNEFIEGNGLDWRKFGCITYDEIFFIIGLNEILNVTIMSIKWLFEHLWNMQQAKSLNKGQN